MAAPKNITVHAEFTCGYMVYPNRRKFQTDGHFLAGLKDKQGKRREWKGKTVHVLVLHYKDQEVLRIMSDSLEDVRRLMAIEILRHFFALFSADYNREFTYNAFQRVNEERNALMQYLIGKGEAETARMLVEATKQAPGEVSHA